MATEVLDVITKLTYEANVGNVDKAVGAIQKEIDAIDKEQKEYSNMQELWERVRIQRDALKTAAFAA